MTTGPSISVQAVIDKVTLAQGAQKSLDLNFKGIGIDPGAGRVIADLRNNIAALKVALRSQGLNNADIKERTEGYRRVLEFTKKTFDLQDKTVKSVELLEDARKRAYLERTKSIVKAAATEEREAKRLAAVQKQIMLDQERAATRAEEQRERRRASFYTRDDKAQLRAQLASDADIQKTLDREKAKAISAINSGILRAEAARPALPAQQNLLNQSIQRAVAQKNAIQSAGNISDVFKFSVDTNGIRRYGTDINATIKNVNDLQKALAKNQAQLQQQAKAFGSAGANAIKFGDQIGLAFRRFGAFVIGSAPLFIIASSFKNATDEAVKFEKAQTRIAQILEISRDRAADIVNASRVSAGVTGTKPTEALSGTDILAQAGVNDPKELKKLTDLFSKVPLISTFGSVPNVAEGLVAIREQFNVPLSDTEDILDRINELSKRYAVEQKDFFEGIRRGGAAFQAAGGSLREYLELTTLVSSRTKLSAETVGTFFKTISLRLADPKVDKYIRFLGEDPTGLKTPSDKFNALARGTQRVFGDNANENNDQFLRIAKDIAGTFQATPFIALLKAINKDNGKVSKVFEEGKGSFNRDANIALEDLGQSFKRLQAAIDNIIIDFSQNGGIRFLVKEIADLATSFGNGLKGLSSILVPLLGILGLKSLSLAKDVGIGFLGRTGLSNTIRARQINADTFFPLGLRENAGNFNGVPVDFNQRANLRFRRFGRGTNTSIDSILSRDFETRAALSGNRPFIRTPSEVFALEEDFYANRPITARLADSRFFRNKDLSQNNVLRKIDSASAFGRRNSGVLNSISAATVGLSIIGSSFTSPGSRANEAFSGAASGATVGALVGSIFGPLGTAIGSVVGGLAGLVKGLVSFSNELKKTEEAVKFQKQFDVVNQRLSSGKTFSDSFKDFKGNPLPRDQVVKILNELTKDENKDRLKSLIAEEIKSKGVRAGDLTVAKSLQDLFPRITENNLGRSAKNFDSSKLSKQTLDFYRSSQFYRSPQGALDILSNQQSNGPIGRVADIEREIEKETQTLRKRSESLIEKGFTNYANALNSLIDTSSILLDNISEKAIATSAALEAPINPFDRKGFTSGGVRGNVKIFGNNNIFSTNFKTRDDLLQRSASILSTNQTDVNGIRNSLQNTLIDTLKNNGKAEDPLANLPEVLKDLIKQISANASVPRIDAAKALSKGVEGVAQLLDESPLTKSAERISKAIDTQGEQINKSIEYLKNFNSAIIQSQSSINDLSLKAAQIRGQGLVNDTELSIRGGAGSTANLLASQRVFIQEQIDQINRNGIENPSRLSNRLQQIQSNPNFIQEPLKTDPSYLEKLAERKDLITEASSLRERLIVAIDNTSKSFELVKSKAEASADALSRVKGSVQQGASLVQRKNGPNSPFESVITKRDLGILSDFGQRFNEAAGRSGTSSLQDFVEKLSVDPGGFERLLTGNAGTRRNPVRKIDSAALLETLSKLPSDFDLFGNGISASQFANADAAAVGARALAPVRSAVTGDPLDKSFADISKSLKKAYDDATRDREELKNLNKVQYDAAIAQIAAAKSIQEAIKTGFISGNVDTPADFKSLIENAQLITDKVAETQKTLTESIAILTNEGIKTYVQISNFDVNVKLTLDDALNTFFNGKFKDDLSQEIEVTVDRVFRNRTQEGGLGNPNGNGDN